MVLKEALKEQFLSLGAVVEDEAILNKCLDICDTYSLDEETLVETWMAFSISHFGGANPTVDTLGQMERKELKKDNKLPSLSRKDNDLPKIAVYNSHSSKQYGDNEDILEIYGSKQPTTPKAKRLRSPELELESPDVKVRAVESPFSPSSFSPKTSTPSRYPTNASKGKILLSFGSEIPSWKNVNPRKVLVGKTLDPHVPSNAVYMNERLVSKAAALDLVCQDMGESLCAIFNELEKGSQLAPQSVETRAQGNFETYGRICCDAEGKLNSASVLLEGSRNLSNGLTMKLDLSNVRQYSIFPGQIVAVEGVNPTGGNLVVSKLFADSCARTIGVPDFEGKLNIVVAAGPFTQPDNLSYQPLWDLVEYAAENKPHVLLLIGPFVDFNHPEIQACSMAETFQELFEKIVGRIMDGLENTCTEVVIVSSNRDVHHEPIYPTPEFSVSKELGKYQNLHLMPDPCMLNIEGLIVGTTSVDTLMHLGREEISSNATGMDRLGRLATHVLAQRCFYPVIPPSEEVSVDAELWEKYAFMDQKPHLLILPSNMRYFCKDLKQCVVLNPERLAKCSFARLSFTSATKGVWNKDNVSCQILKI